MSIKYHCLKCGITRKKKFREKTYNKILTGGKKIKVPVCCGHKMEIATNESIS